MNPRIACIQLRAGSSPDDNLAAAEGFVRQAAADGAEIALLPERWEAFGSSEEIRAAAEPIDGPRLAAVQGWARELGMAIVAGSVAERVEGDERLRNTLDPDACAPSPTPVRADERLERVDLVGARVLPEAEEHHLRPAVGHDYWSVSASTSAT